jgi:hypothetical protein
MQLPKKGKKIDCFIVFCWIIVEKSLILQPDNV